MSIAGLDAKYLPVWLPRFLCFDSSLTLSRAVYAAARAEGFLPSLLPPVPQPPDTFAEAVRLQEHDLLRPARPHRRLSQQQQARLDKHDRLVRDGVDPYPVAVPRTATLAGVREAHPGLPPDTRTGVRVSVTGRVRALRDLGGVVFAGLRDGDTGLQVMLTAETTPADPLRRWRRTVDRIVMLLTGTPIRATLAFPFHRPAVHLPS